MRRIGYAEFFVMVVNSAFRVTLFFIQQSFIYKKAAIFIQPPQAESTESTAGSAACSLNQLST